MKLLASVLVLIAIGGNSQQQLLSGNIRSDIAEEARLDFVKIAEKFGQRTEQYDITTQDGYILKLFRIVGDKSRPVILIHGAVDSSNSFIIRGNTSLAIQLASENYDVWAMNFRGNYHSRRHVKWNPDTDEEFWNFSVHEIGYYDIPAIIDFVLKSTGQQTLSVIGFSEGTTSLYVLGALRPEYNEKINICISLAPICYLHDIGKYLAAVVKSSAWINTALAAVGVNEVLGYHSAFRRLYELLCTRRDIYGVCITNGLFLVTGSDPEEIEPKFVPVIVGHFPAGNSRKNFYHFAQISRRRNFTMFDYGPSENLARYKSKTAPTYDLSKVTMKIALFVAKNDLISTIKNVNLLRKRLPNVVDYRVMTRDKFNHVDYIWGRNTHKTMHPQILEILDRYK